jgi:hypothetical protein
MGALLCFCRNFSFAVRRVFLLVDSRQLIERGHSHVGVLLFAVAHIKPASLAAGDLSLALLLLNLGISFTWLDIPLNLKMKMQNFVSFIAVREKIMNKHNAVHFLGITAVQLHEANQTFHQFIRIECGRRPVGGGWSSIM